MATAILAELLVYSTNSVFRIMPRPCFSLTMCTFWLCPPTSTYVQLAPINAHICDCQWPSKWAVVANGRTKALTTNVSFCIIIIQYVSAQWWSQWCNLHMPSLSIQTFEHLIWYTEQFPPTSTMITIPSILGLTLKLLVEEKSTWYGVNSEKTEMPVLA